jgi:hypothetical protein
MPRFERCKDAALRALQRCRASSAAKMPRFERCKDAALRALQTSAPATRMLSASERPPNGSDRLLARLPLRYGAEAGCRLRLGCGCPLPVPDAGAGLRVCVQIGVECNRAGG